MLMSGSGDPANAIAEIAGSDESVAHAQEMTSMGIIDDRAA
jgi:hypothetical protein